MMKYIHLLFVLIIFQGCVALDVSYQDTNDTTQFTTDKPVTKIDYVFIGMSQDEVKEVLGEKLIIGYVRSDKDKQVLKPITLDSPYKRETFSGKVGSYEVVYYYTHVKKADTVIAEEETTPLVFENEKLIGKGWDFLFRLKENQ